MSDTTQWLQWNTIHPSQKGLLLRLMLRDKETLHCAMHRIEAGDSSVSSGGESSPSPRVYGL